MVPALALLAVNFSKSASVAAAWLTVAVGASAFSQAGFLVNFQVYANPNPCLFYLEILTHFFHVKT
jgi:hypothetical protein